MNELKQYSQASWAEPNGPSSTWTKCRAANAIVSLADGLTKAGTTGALSDGLPRLSAEEDAASAEIRRAAMALEVAIGAMPEDLVLVALILVERHHHRVVRPGALGAEGPTCAASRPT